MFAKGPQAGATPKDEALAALPAGARCKRVTAMGITGYVISLPDGRRIASAGNAQKAWEGAKDWAERQGLKTP